MRRDPYTLHVALDKTGRARGELYLDDGETYANQQGQFVWREFSAQQGKKPKSIRITSTDLTSLPDNKAVEGSQVTKYDPMNAFATSIENVRVERVVVLGLWGKPNSVRVEGGKELKWHYDEGVSAPGKKEGGATVLTIKDPAVKIIRDWAIVIE